VSNMKCFSYSSLQLVLEFFFVFRFDTNLAIYTRGGHRDAQKSSCKVGYTYIITSVNLKYRMIEVLPSVLESFLAVRHAEQRRELLYILLSTSSAFPPNERTIFSVFWVIMLRKLVQNGRLGTTYRSHFPRVKLSKKKLEQFDP
jgi:hypothetical protein